MFVWATLGPLTASAQAIRPATGSTIEQSDRTNADDTTTEVATPNAAALMMFAESLAELGDYEAAAPLLQWAVELHRFRHGESHPLTGQAIEVREATLDAATNNAMIRAEAIHGHDRIAARFEFERTVHDLRSRCYPRTRHPIGHRRLAQAMRSLGDVHLAWGERGEARKWYQQSLEMQQAIDDRDCPAGHPDTADAHLRLSSALHAHGEYRDSGFHAVQAVRILREVYNPQEYPDGHADLAQGLTQLAYMRGGDLKSVELYEEALGVQRKLYPDGHRQIASTLLNLGNALIPFGETERALECFTEALAVSERLGDAISFEQATTQQYLGRLNLRLGRFAEALEHFDDAIRTFEQLYPSDWYPRGHDHLASARHEYAVALCAAGEHVRAAEQCELSETMRYRIAAAHIPDVSEAEALNFTILHLDTPDLLISVWPASGRDVGELYEQIWKRRGLIHRVLANRQDAARRSTLPEVRELLGEYQQVRRQLTRFAFTQAPNDPQRLQELRKKLVSLTVAKESLERRLAVLVPESSLFAARASVTTPNHAELLPRLPQATALVDFVRFNRYCSLVGVGHDDEADAAGTPVAGQVSAPVACYAAFVLTQSAGVRRVDLGPAEPIEDLVRSWRQALMVGEVQERGIAAKVSEMVWEPIVAALPDGIRHIYISPDGIISAIPWPALPDHDRGSILLEHYAFATVPHGTLLLEQLVNASGESTEIAAAFPNRQSRVLTVGDVAFRQASAELDSDRDWFWTPLPGTKQELDNLAALSPAAVVNLQAADATVQNVLAELPNVDYAHLATHGFFADAQTQSLLGVDPESFEARGGSIEYRGSVAARNPLLLSGLVLAPAGSASVAPLPIAVATELTPVGGDDILTAESIASLPLSGLRLAVLSACDTGLGDVAGGEGIFGLQRAFHQAGTRNVIASLWKVSDQPTAALMRLFYINLWEQGMPPIDALRQAQLAIHRHPVHVETLAGVARGPNFDRVVKLVTDDEAATDSQASPRWWAGFVLSGSGL